MKFKVGDKVRSNHKSYLNGIGIIVEILPTGVKHLGNNYMIEFDNGDRIEYCSLYFERVMNCPEYLK